MVLDVKTLRSGIYIVHIHSDNRQQTFKLVKQ
jgi:uncharacterized Rossmann fold enzyme